MMARVRGSFMAKLVPWPFSEVIRSIPPRDSTLVLTTSSPTPRPETPLTSVADVNPGLERKRKISSSVNALLSSW